MTKVSRETLDALARIKAAESEAGWQQVIVDYARLSGWLAYHTHDSRHSAKGFPDLVLARHGRLVFAELKSADPRSKLSRDQKQWLARLLSVPGIEVYLWRPEDWPAVQRILARPPAGDQVPGQLPLIAWDTGNDR